MSDIHNFGHGILVLSCSGAMRRKHYRRSNQLGASSNYFSRKKVIKLSKRINREKTQSKIIKRKFVLLSNELQKTQQEVYLTRMQLRQVQEELERFFLLSQQLQTQLDSIEPISSEQKLMLKDFKHRLLNLYKARWSEIHKYERDQGKLETFIMRQHHALQRFRALFIKLDNTNIS